MIGEFTSVCTPEVIGREIADALSGFRGEPGWAKAVAKRLYAVSTRRQAKYLKTAPRLRADDYARLGQALDDFLYVLTGKKPMIHKTGG